jgi:hypothetical protein
MCYSLSMNPFESTSNQPTVEKTQRKEQHHILVFLRAWKQIAQLLQHKTDEDIVISRLPIKSVLYHEVGQLVAQLLKITHNYDAQNIWFHLQFHQREMNEMLGLVCDSPLYDKIFSQNTVQVWDIGSKDISFNISESEKISMKLVHHRKERIFELDINYATIKQILPYIPNIFPILVLKTTLKSINKNPSI